MLRHKRPGVHRGRRGIGVRDDARDRCDDRDRLTYKWTASNGKITGNGLTATWVRVVPEPNVIKPGVVTV